MSIYKENFPVGSTVRIAEKAQLEDFRQTWKFHHKLLPEQLDYAGKIAEVEDVSFYHGGDVLYKLRDIPGLWHEICVSSSV